MHFFERFDFNQLLDNVAKSFGLSRLADKDGILIKVLEA